MPSAFPFDCIRIARPEFDRVMRYGLSLNEIGALCFGHENLITKVVRVPNILRSRDYFEWDRAEYRRVLVAMESLGQELIGELHSHSMPYHANEPTLMDRRYFRRNAPHLIAFPTQGKVRCWMLQKSRRLMLQSEILVRIDAPIEESI